MRPLQQTRENPDNQPGPDRHERLLDRADFLRAEQKDREMEEAQDKLEALTPETTAKAYYAFPPSGALGLKFKVVDVSFARDLEQRLRHTEDALAAAMRWVFVCNVQNANRERMIAEFDQLKKRFPKP